MRLRIGKASKRIELLAPLFLIFVFGGFLWTRYTDMVRDDLRLKMWTGLGLMNYDETRNLINQGADINDRGNDGMTPLMIASYLDEKDTVELLIKVGADVNLKDGRGRTALMIAKQKGYADIVSLLEKTRTKTVH